MAIIKDVRIFNFRGISELQWWPNPGINCLIGPGDGGKSTILDAIDLAIGAKRNVTFTDADFHKCNVSEPIIIDITLGGLETDLLNLESYGHFHRGWNPSTGEYSNETALGLETVLTMRVIVRDDLEPEWSLYSEGASAEGRERTLHWKHRQNISPTRLGVVASQHMALGPRSVLGKISDDTAQASLALANASRHARKSFADEGCAGVDDIIVVSERIAKSMGIPIKSLMALLDVKGVTFSGGAIALHDSDHVPLKNLGSGSMRLLVAGLQKQVSQSSISIIDEVEFGLEPYRIIRLLDSLGAKSNDQTKQVFMTTHSPIVLRELSSIQIHAVRKRYTSTKPVTENGIEITPAQEYTENKVFPLGGKEQAQKTVRACAEAFLAPSVIVCEGKTEIGILRGFDLHEQSLNHQSMLSNGCHWADGDGSSMMERAKIFADMGYRTALFMDSDVEFTAQTYSELSAGGVTVFQWDQGLSTEMAIFNSLSAAQIPTALDIAIAWRSEDSIDARIQNTSGRVYNLQTCKNNFQDAMRPILGKCAGDGKWFKDIEPAERLFREVIAPNWQDVGSQLKQPIDNLWSWVYDL